MFFHRTGSGRTQSFDHRPSKKHRYDGCQDECDDTLFLLHHVAIFLFSLIFGQSCLYHQCTLDPFLLHLASDLVNIVDLTCEIVGVCRASAAAVEPCKALAALLLGINVAFFEFVDSFCLFHAFVNISEAEIFLSYELVARIEIAPRCYRKVLGSGTAAGKTFINTWSAGQIDHKVEEIEASSLIFLS